MIINQATLQAIYQSFRVLFFSELERVEPLWPRIAMRAPSKTKKEVYPWLGSFPGMREWIGDRVIKSVALHDYTITNKSWESTIEVDRDDIADDTIGIYNPVVQEVARAAGTHPDELVFSLLSLGFSTTCYDGQYFFDTDHPVKKKDGSIVSVSNTGGGTGTAWYLLDTSKAVKPIIFQEREPLKFTALDSPTDENVFKRKKFLYGADARYNVGFGFWQLAYASKQTLDATNYASARAAMMSLKNDEERPLNIRPNLLVVPPSLEGAAREILLSERDASGATNPWRNTADLLVVPWLA